MFLTHAWNVTNPTDISALNSTIPIDLPMSEALCTPSNRQVMDEPVLTEYTFTGTVEKAGWTKSIESFYAGGSEYYSFHYEIPNAGGATSSVILRADAKKTADITSIATLLDNAAKAGYKVKITGWRRSEKMPVVDDGMQHPVNMDDSVPTLLIKTVESLQ